MIKIEYFATSKITGLNGLGINFQFFDQTINCIYHSDAKIVKEFWNSFCLITRPKQGKIFIDGYDVFSSPKQRFYSQIFLQHVGVIDEISPWELNMTVIKALSIRIKMCLDWKKHYQINVDKILDEFGLKSLRNIKIKNLGLRDQISFLFMCVKALNFQNIYINFDRFYFAKREDINFFLKRITQLNKLKKNVIVFTSQKDFIEKIPNQTILDLQKANQKISTIPQLYLSVQQISKKQNKKCLCYQMFNCVKAIFYRLEVFYLIFCLVTTILTAFAVYIITITVFTEKTNLESFFSTIVLTTLGLISFLGLYVSLLCFIAYRAKKKIKYFYYFGVNKKTILFILWATTIVFWIFTTISLFIFGCFLTIGDKESFRNEILRIDFLISFIYFLILSILSFFPPFLILDDNEKRKYTFSRI